MGLVQEELVDAELDIAGNDVLRRLEAYITKNPKEILPISIQEYIKSISAETTAINPENIIDEFYIIKDEIIQGKLKEFYDNFKGFLFHEIGNALGPINYIDKSIQSDYQDIEYTKRLNLYFAIVLGKIVLEDEKYEIISLLNDVYGSGVAVDYNFESNNQKLEIHYYFMLIISTLVFNAYRYMFMMNKGSEAIVKDSSLKTSINLEDGMVEFQISNPVTDTRAPKIIIENMVSYIQNKLDEDLNNTKKVAQSGTLMTLLLLKHIFNLKPEMQEKISFVFSYKNDTGVMKSVDLENYYLESLRDVGKFIEASDGKGEVTFKLRFPHNFQI